MLPATERFCAGCGLPLIPIEDGAPATEAHARARKIDPAYAEGRLVRVAFANNQAEAELIQGLLLEEGIPTMLRRSGGFDVPDFLAAGPRDVLAPESGAHAARDLLLSADMGELAAGGGQGGNPPRITLVVAVLGGGFVTAVIAWLIGQAL